VSAARQRSPSTRRVMWGFCWVFLGDFACLCWGILPTIFPFSGFVSGRLLPSRGVSRSRGLGGDFCSNFSIRPRVLLDLPTHPHRLCSSQAPEHGGGRRGVWRREAVAAGLVVARVGGDAEVSTPIPPSPSAFSLLVRSCLGLCKMGAHPARWFP
jgi:hypothetical protein